MEYNKESLINILDLGENYNKGTNIVKVAHKIKLNTYKNNQDGSWLAIVDYIFLNGSKRYFYGKTEAEVLENGHSYAENLYNLIIDRHEKQNAKLKSYSRTDDEESDNSEDVKSEFQTISSKTGKNAGKKWIGNPKTKERLRVDPEQISQYLSEGWIIAGTRTEL